MNVMEISFNAIMVNEPFARTAVVSFIGHLNPTMEELVELKTLVSEAVANSIIHGYNNQPDKKIYLRVSYDLQRQISIEIQDFGVGIEDVELARQPLYTTRPDEQRAGMGLSIIESFSDTLKIHSVRGLGTKITVTKALAPIYQAAK